MTQIFLKIIILAYSLLALQGCKLLGEDQETESLKQMLIIGAVEPDSSSENGFLSARPDGVSLELVKEGDIIDSKVVMRDIASNSYTFDFAGLYPTGDLHIRARHQNQFLEMYIGDPSRHQGPLMVGAFPMSKAALATRIINNVSYFPEIKKLNSSTIIDLMAYLISIPVSAMQNRTDLLLGINKLQMNSDGTMVISDKFFPEWDRHPDRFTNMYEKQLGENIKQAGIAIQIDERNQPSDYEANNLLQNARIIVSNNSHDIPLINNAETQPIKLGTNSQQISLLLTFKANINDDDFIQLLNSSLKIQGREGLQKSYSYQKQLSDFDPLRESSNSLSVKLIKPAEQINYASHYSLENDLSSTTYADQYQLKLFFSLN